MSEKTAVHSSLNTLLFPTLSERTVTIATLALILAGCALRLLWMSHGHAGPVSSEAFFIARSLSEGRGYTDAFGPGTGPTAHLMPLTPLPAALAYSVFGAGTQAGELALTLWALAALSAALFLGQCVLRELGAPPLARLAAVAIVAIFPIQYALEVLAFRVWEGAIAAAALLAMLLALLRLDRRETINARALILIGMGNGLIFLINPATALGSSGAIGIFLLRSVSWRRWWLPVAAAAAVMAAVIVPWGLRNERVLGEFVPLRTGTGISVAIAYYDGRADQTDIQAKDIRRFREISPLMSEANRQRYLQMGEIPYNRALREMTSKWVASHKSEVLRLRVMNFVQFYAPPAWLWQRFTSSDGAFVQVRSLLVMLASVVAALTVAVGLARRRYRWLYIAAAIVPPCLPYMMTFSLLRYRYVVSTLLIFIAVAGAWQLLGVLTRQPRDSTQDA